MSTAWLVWTRILLRDCARRALGVEHAALSRAWMPAAVRKWAHCVLPDAVSVLIPARNEERVIAASIASLLASRGVQIEIIVLDDALDRSNRGNRAQLRRPGSARAPRVFASAAGRLEWQAARLLCARGHGPLEHPLLSRRRCASCSRSSRPYVRVSGALRLRPGQRLSPPGDGDSSGVAAAAADSLRAAFVSAAGRHARLVVRPASRWAAVSSSWCAAMPTARPAATRRSAPRCMTGCCCRSSFAVMVCAPILPT